MLIRISLIVAILAALAAGTLSVMQVRDKITTFMSQRDDYHTQRDTVQGELNTTNRILVVTQANLKQTQQDLADTKDQLATETKLAADETRKANDLSDKLAKTTQERDDAQGQLGAYKATLLTPDQVLHLNRDLKEAQGTIEAINEEKTVLERKNERLQARLDKYEGTNEFVILPASLHGKILVVDPKWDFVVLNVGDDQGVKENGELLVSREGKLVAKVIVRTIEKDRCIANLVPGWKLGELIEGDEVTPAHPAS